jgi:hypothetical protein
VTDENLLQDLVLRYHRAHADHDADALRACHADSYIRWLGHGSDDPADRSPAASCTAEYMALWGQDPDVNTSTYDFDVTFVSTRPGEDLAIVVTEESGGCKNTDGQRRPRLGQTRRWPPGRPPDSCTSRPAWGTSGGWPACSGATPTEPVRDPSTTA